jgi:hypothetical protein
MIPALTAEGLLPPGIHHASWVELERRFGYNPTRRRLLSGLRRAAKALALAGCEVLYLDGSFVTDKEEPGDYDGCWEEGGVDPSRLDPILLTFDHKRVAQKLKYGGELFPANLSAEGSPPSRVFLDFFQADRDGRAKGIIAIDLKRHRP